MEYIFVSFKSISYLFSPQVLKAADDSASQYMNFMNVIFTAQKQVKLSLFISSSRV